jgi:hypothetical protein
MLTCKYDYENVLFAAFIHILKIHCYGTEKVVSKPSNLCDVKVKVKVSQNITWEEERERTDIALLNLNLDDNLGCVVKNKPRQLYPRKQPKYLL